MSAPAPDTSLTALRERYGERYRWLLLLSVMVGTMASIMSSTIINVAIPDMSQHFTLGQERAQWVTSGFMAAMTVSMLTTPWLLARYGYRRTYAGCMWLLMAGGVAGGFAQHFPLVLAARVAEGLAAGVVQPIPAIIILRAFEPHEQGRASGIFGMGVVLAPAIGPSIGGLLVDGFGWRSIFFMVVPFCLASLWLARRFVPTTAPGGGAANPQGAALDWRGLLLATAGTLCLLNGLVELRGGSPALAMALLAGATLIVLGFVVLQRRTLKARQRQPDAGVDPLMNLSMFKDRRFAMGSIVAVIYGTALFGSTYLLPVYMQMGLRLSASFVGTILLPAGLVLAVTIAVVGAAVGPAAHAPPGEPGAGAAGRLLRADAHHRRTGPGAHHHPAGGLGHFGAASGWASSCLRSTWAPCAGWNVTTFPQGASVINFLRMLGGAAGVSLCGIVLEWRLEAHGVQLNSAGISPARLAAFDETFLMLAALCGLAIIAAWRLRAERAAD